MKSRLTNSAMIAFAIIAIGFLGCKDEDELPEVEAAFTQTVDKLTGAVSFFNISENASQYEWDFGDGTTSTEINPVKTFRTGTYEVVLTASNKAGDSDAFERPSATVRIRGDLFSRAVGLVDRPRPPVSIYL